MTTDESLVVPNVHGRWSPVSFVPKCNSFEEWREIGRCLRSLHNSVLWWVGDWLRFGRGKWGEMYSQVMDDTDYSYDMLRRALAVSEAFDVRRRRPNLSWSHHRETLYMEESARERWLDMAEKEGWSVRRMRDEIAAEKVLAERTGDPPPRKKGHPPTHYWGEPLPADKEPLPAAKEPLPPAPAAVAVEEAPAWGESRPVARTWVIEQDTVDEIEAWLRGKVNTVWMESDLLKLMSLIQGV